MIVIIAPAKKLDYIGPSSISGSQPRFMTEAEQLVEVLRTMKPGQLSSLMHISQVLAELNAQRYADFSVPFTPANAYPAIYYFQGEVYKSLDIGSLNQQSIEWLKDHLRMLSGLYGLLRPLDLIQPYRLEMGVPLTNPQGKNLYDFWGDKITRALVEDMEATGQSLLVNLASNEYANAIHTHLLPTKPIQPVFKDYKNGVYKFIYLFARQARGLMARFIVENSIDNPTDLAAFNVAGYKYSPKDSSPEQPVFLRKRQAVA